MNKKAHLTQEGIINLRTITSGMNDHRTKFNSKLSTIFLLHFLKIMSNNIFPFFI